MTGFEIVAGGIIIVLTVVVGLLARLVDDKQRAKCKLFDEMSELKKKLAYTTCHIDAITKRNRDSLVGARVMCCSNESDLLWVGTLVCFVGVSQAHNLIPVIVDDAGKECHVMGIVIPYNEKILTEIKDMSGKEQWDYMIENKLGLRWE